MTSLDFSTAKDQSVIGANTQHAPVRQNFTTAHELGHLLMLDQEQLHIDHAFRVRLRDDVGLDVLEINFDVVPWLV
jgi:Zn-dependent peptidase ImmA (M78 family)